MVAEPEIYLTPDEYLLLEENSDIKHEYIDGYIYAMAGALEPHVTFCFSGDEGIFLITRPELKFRARVAQVR